MIYPYQMYQARVSGADAVLLIAAILSDEDLRYFIRIAKALGMNALVEVHSQEELNRVLAIESIKLIGINNRNLEDFTTNLDTTCQLIAYRQTQIQAQDILIVSESGIHHSEHLRLVSEAGAQAVLIGESLMKHSDPGRAISALFAES